MEHWRRIQWCSIIGATALALTVAVGLGRSAAGAQQEAASVHAQPSVWPTATTWGRIGDTTRARLAEPTADYPAAVLRGKAYADETAGYRVEKRIECDLNADGAVEAVIATQNGRERWSRWGPQGEVMVFDGRTKRLVYRSQLGLEVAELLVLQDGLPGAGPVVVALGRAGWEWGAQAGGTIEIVSWNADRRCYQRLLKVGGEEGHFLRWYLMQWGFPEDSLHLCGLLYDASSQPVRIDAEIGKGIVVVTYDWVPTQRRFILSSP